MEGVAGDGGGSGYCNRIIHGARCGLGKLRIGSVGDESTGVRIGDIVLYLLPLRNQGNIVVRHDESAGSDFCIRNVFGCPASEGITSFRGHISENVDLSILVLRVGGLLAPCAAIQIVCHLIARDILGVEVHIAVGDGIGESYLAAGTVNIGVPAVKGVGNAIRYFRCRKIANHGKVCRFRLIILVVVLSRFPFIARSAGIPQIVGSGVDIPCTNFNGAVYMVPFVTGNLIGMQDNCFYIVRRLNCAHSTLERFVDRHPVAPGSCILGDGIAAAGGAVRPGDNSASRIEAVFIVLKSCACNVDRALSQTLTPLINTVGLRIAGRRLQVVEISNICRFSRSSDGNRMGSSFACAGTIRDRDGNGSFTGLDTVNLTGLVHGEDFLVAALPDRGKNGRVIGGQGGGQLGIGERLHCGRSGDADFGQSGSGNGDGLGSGDTHAVRYLNSRGSGFQSRNDAGR